MTQPEHDLVRPDRWVVLKITTEHDEVIYKVLGGWSGSYLYGGSWRLNSGIVDCTFDGDYWYFEGYSGSVYKCYVDSYGFNTTSADIYGQLKGLHGDKVSVLEDQEWNKEGFNWV